jgi:hypothetical protein
MKYTAEKKNHNRLRQKQIKIPVYATQKNCDAQLRTLCTQSCIDSRKMNIQIFGNRTREDYGGKNW